MLLLAVAACKKDEITEGGDPVPEPGATYLLEGTVNTEGFAWKTNSSVGLYSAMDAVRIINKECKIVGWADTTPVYDEDGNNTNDYTPSEYEGKAVARFNTPALDLVQGENKFMVYTPYNSELTYTAGTIYGLSIGDNQRQTAPNVAADCFAIGYATGTPGVDEAFKFELNPVTALAQVKIGSSVFTGYSPQKVSIYDDSGTTIAGGFNINVETNEIQPVGDPLTSVAVTVQNPVALASGQTQNLYLNILPADFSTKPVWVVVELVDAAGGKVTIPTQQTGLKFTAGQTTLIDLSDLTAEDNDAGAWYCPDDSRILSGLGYAYGQANTFFIQCKNGSTYNGATYSPNAKIPDEVVIDYRVRGNFASITEDMKPEGVTFEWFKLSDGRLYTPRTTGYTSSNVVISEDTFTVTPDEANHTVTVRNTGSFAGAPILVMKKNGKILWAWSFWNVAADGTSIDPVTVGNYKFAPMDLGQPTTNADAWTANNNYPMYSMNLLYQWGRPYPIFWNSFWSIDMVGTTQTSNVPSVFVPMTLSESLSSVGMIINHPEDQNMSDWTSDTDNLLWGSESLEEDGAKTIYDPCPEGWKVVSGPALTALLANTPSYVTEGYKYSMTLGGVTFYNNGYCNAKIPANGDPMGDPNDKANRPTNMQFANGKSNRGWMWCNVAGDLQGQSLYWTAPTFSPPEDPRMASFNKSTVLSVRCIVDDDNR